MKLICFKVVAFLFVALAFPQEQYAQEIPEHSFVYEVKKVYPPVSISKAKLKEAKTLIDINKRYEASWVREYKMVEISARCKGKLENAVGENDELNREQMELMLRADLGSEIMVRVEYIPENNLSLEEVKEMDFSFILDPKYDAQFVGGEDQLQKYLRENAIDKIATTDFKEYQMAAYKFTIGEDGHVVNPHVFWTSEDETMDELLLGVICNMPKWEPAKYEDGTKVQQEFVLAVGDMRSCVVNLLSINQ